MAVETRGMVRVAELGELEARGRLVVRAGDRPVVLFLHEGRVHAVDNRCPHMGFPLHRGTVEDGVLTCHWHHARFDLCTGGTFDPWADDAQTYPAVLHDRGVYLDLARSEGRLERLRGRLRDGLEQELGLVIAKSVIGLADADPELAEPFGAGLIFGATYREAGWGQGLTMHAAFANLLPHLAPEDRPLALYHGLTAVARDAAGHPPRFPQSPLPAASTDAATLERWFRRFVAVRDAGGAERCVATAVRAGTTERELARMLFAAATDHRYIGGGHTLDFINKAFEALDRSGWAHAELVLTSLVRGLTTAQRMEESNAWRNPVDVVALVDDAFRRLPDAVAAGASVPPATAGPLIETLLGDDPQAIVALLLGELRRGVPGATLAGAVAHAAALRIARFGLANDYGDWDTALHTFTFAHAVEMAVCRAGSVDALRGMFDAAMSVYLDRFLNVPPARLPDGAPGDASPEELLGALPELLDGRQRVDEAGELVARYLATGADPAPLLAALGRALLREDRDFHTIQMVEAAFRQFDGRQGSERGAHVLIAAARYLAAHAATPRAQLQTYTVAARLYRGERVYEDD